MKSANFAGMTVEQLVDRFSALAVEQDDAMLMDDGRRVNKLYWQMDTIKKELKSRSGDQRRALLPLCGHPNMQVRVKAAVATLAVAPEAARQVLEEIASSGWQPQALDAGMTLFLLDEGTFVPE